MSSKHCHGDCWSSVVSRRGCEFEYCFFICLVQCRICFCEHILKHSLSSVKNSTFFLILLAYMDKNKHFNVVHYFYLSCSLEDKILGSIAFITLYWMLSSHQFPYFYETFGRKKLLLVPFFLVFYGSGNSKNECFVLFQFFSDLFLYKDCHLIKCVPLGKNTFFCICIELLGLKLIALLYPLTVCSVIKIHFNWYYQTSYCFCISPFLCLFLSPPLSLYINHSILNTLYKQCREI